MSLVGGGALPGQQLPSVALAITIPGMTASELASRLRTLPVPIVARVEGEEVLLDIRTVLPADRAPLLRGIAAIVSSRG